MSLTTIRRGKFEASVDSFGAQLVSLKVAGKEYLWQGDERWWTGHSPVLFPIVGCLRDGKAHSSQGPVTLKRHGVARLFEHEVVDPGHGHVCFELRSNDETRALFPYDFKLNMCYTIANDALEQRYVVTNTGQVPLPFTLGGHPAFNIPVPGAEDRDFSSYELKFARKWTYSSPTLDPETELWDFSARKPLLDNSRTLPLSHELLNGDTLLFEDVPMSTVAVVGSESGRGIAVDFDGFDYLGVWSAAGGAPFVCLEPWTGCATCKDESDVFEEKRGTVMLAPGEVYERAFSIRPF